MTLRSIVILLAFTTPLAAQTPTPFDKGEYVKKGNRADTIRATLASFGMPNLEGKWYYAGPFDNAYGNGFDAQYAPEKEKPISLKSTYVGKNGQKFGWKELPKFELGKIYDLAKLFPNDKTDGVVYLFHEFDSKVFARLPLSLGSDDTISVFHHGERILHANHVRPAAPDQDSTLLKVREGKNQLMLKVCQLGGGWEVYANPEMPDYAPPQIIKRLDKDYARPNSNSPTGSYANEAKFYRVATFETPADCVLEVGGLGFRPDGKLLACTRRGEVWLVTNPTAENTADAKFTRYASGLHESLGLYVQDNKTTFVVQRPEMTKLVDANEDGRADEFLTFSDKWGVSGDYHEFAFGPARDKNGDFFISLNVGFGGGHQAKSPWRGWCIKIDGKTGEMEPWAYGLRSPNGINISPDGDLFYCDNQGEWVATNKMHHIKKGKFYGHQAGLLWIKNSPFVGKVSDKVTYGMMYDGQPPFGKTSPKGLPEVDPPCIWFPYGRMGQSVSEPIWDTTGGKFGPFAGQCFVGDQTKSMVMRVDLQKTDGIFQGVCFPFRSGLQCGVNRLAFGPDGGLYVGQTNRGWGSVGGKPHGLQRISFNGVVPFEVQTMKATKEGFDLTFTKPVDPKSVEKAAAYSLKSFTYLYTSQYGYPETDTQGEKVEVLGVSADGKTVKLAVPDRRIGRVYDFKFNDMKAADGEELLHAEAYFTLNAIPK
jgi:Glucose / Sorbosone dehydrogenase